MRVAPSREDWEAAFLRLSPADRVILSNKPLNVAVSSALVDGTVYDIIDDHGSNQVDRDERIDIAAVCDGFNRRFSNTRSARWQIVAATTYTGVSTPSGISIDRFTLKWSFRSPIGSVVVASSTEFGPGVKIIWGASQEAIVADINQAFALAFLKLVVQLAGPIPTVSGTNADGVM